MKEGDRVGRLVLVRLDRVQRRASGGPYRFWICRCDCGQEKIIRETSLLTGCSKSCGCLQRELAKAAHTIHGRFRESEYTSWVSMKKRCDAKKHQQYKNYDGRGISYCERWKDYDNFLQDMGRKTSPRHTLDRIDNSKDYSPENCRWATRQQQAENKRTTIKLVVNQRTVCLKEYCKINGLNYGAILQRKNRYGWTLEASIREEYDRRR